MKRTLSPDFQDDEDRSGKWPEYCRTIIIKGSNGSTKELVFPRALDLDRPKRARTMFSSTQLERLETRFAKNQYLVGKERVDLAQELDLTEMQVKVWFQNRRTKQKKDSEKEKTPPPPPPLPRESAASIDFLKLLESTTPFLSTTPHDTARSSAPSFGAASSTTPFFSSTPQIPPPSLLRSTGADPTLDFALTFPASLTTATPVTRNDAADPSTPPSASKPAPASTSVAHFLPTPLEGHLSVFGLPTSAPPTLFATTSRTTAPVTPPISTGIVFGGRAAPRSPFAASHLPFWSAIYGGGAGWPLSSSSSSSASSLYPTSSSFPLPRPSSVAIPSLNSAIDSTSV